MKKEKSLQVFSIYRTFSGETAGTIRQGQPVVILRLAGCDLRCKWCNTKESQPMNSGQVLNETDLFRIFTRIQCPGDCLLVTGGEPLLQWPTLKVLLDQADELFPLIAIETNGAHSLPRTNFPCTFVVDYKLPGSGMSKRMPSIPVFRKRIAKQMDDKNQSVVKLVCADRTDYVWAKRIAYGLQKLGDTVIAFSAAADLRHETLADWMLEDKLPYLLNVQLHKIIWPNSKKER